MRIAIICHFTNKEIQEILKPRKKINEFAPWIPPIIKLFENDPDNILHIISPHEYINKNINFQLRGVYYHFFNAHMPITGRHWPRFLKLDYWTNFYLNKLKIYHLIKDIKPDIIHLFGAENPYYSSAILQFNNKIPVVITIQGFIFKSTNRSYLINKRIKFENIIIRSFNFFITNTKTVGKDILKINHKAIIYQVNLPIKIIEPINVKKKYDLVFFARITKDKGIEDLLKAVALIKKEKPDISLCIIGSGKLEPFKKLAEELRIQENIYWAGFLPTQEDVHKLASQARISVLPTYHEIISGTIIESLFLELPVVAYNVGSINEVNEYDSIISLVTKGDIQNLAQTILSLLNDAKNLKEISIQGRRRAIEMFSHSSQKIKLNILKAYNNVILNFNK